MAVKQAFSGQQDYTWEELDDRGWTQWFSDKWDPGGIFKSSIAVSVGTVKVHVGLAIIQSAISVSALAQSTQATSLNISTALSSNIIANALMPVTRFDNISLAITTSLVDKVISRQTFTIPLTISTEFNADVVLVGNINMPMSFTVVPGT